VASKLAHLYRHPLVMLVVLVAIAMFAARCGWGHNPVGLWDGPI
jgi:hypothetical protein